MLQIVVKYKMLINNLERLIELSGFSDGYLSRKIGLKPTDFFIEKANRKLNNNRSLKTIIHHKK